MLVRKIVDGPQIKDGSIRSTIAMNKKIKSSRSISKRKRGSSRKRRVPFELTGPKATTISSDLTESTGIFLEAIRGEGFGPHPGLAEIRIKVFVYNPIAKREVRLPGKQLDLLIGTIG